MNRSIRRLTLILAGILLCRNICAQETGLNMTRESFVSLFGEPSEETSYDTDDGNVEMLFYGEDFFSFSNNRLTDMNITSPGFVLTMFQPDGLGVGDSFQKVLQNPQCQLEFLGSYDSRMIYRCYIDGIEDVDFRIIVSSELIYGLIVRSVSSDGFMKREFEAFFESAFNPSAEIPDDSLWPAGIGIRWSQATYNLSRDKSTISCCVPFVPELNTSASYSGRRCPDIARRLVITKILEGSRFKQSIVSLVPKAGLSAGDPFTGLVVYNNVNSGTCFAWDCYEEGKLVYSKYPAQKNPAAVSTSNIGIRIAQTLIYSGGDGVISEKDWSLLAANRLDVTQAFSQSLPPGRTAESVAGEKKKYTFSSVFNPDYYQEESEEQTYNQEQEDTFQEQEDAYQEQEETEAHETQEMLTQDNSEPLPAYLGKADNLSSVLWVENSPLKLEYEERGNGFDENRKTVFVCTNSDFCCYTLKMENGILVKALPGKKEVDGSRWFNRYYYYRGSAVSNVDYKFPYALPVASGSKVRLIRDDREKYRSFAVLMNVGDSVYAMRGGRVCLTEDSRTVLVCHKDGTFAAYMNVDGPGVTPGEYVLPGDPIGICGGGKLSISIFYLDMNKMGGDSRLKYTHLTPYVRTDAGDVKLQTGVEYVSLTDPDIISKEMGPVRKKRYLYNYLQQSE